MNRKQQFLNAVRILAPDDQTILVAAREVREELLPIAPGGAALEFVAAMKRMRSPSRCTAFLPAIRQRRSCRGGGKPGKPGAHALSLSHSLRVRSAEYWLRLGEPVQALMELERLSEVSKRHPSALKVHLEAVRVLREMNESTIQE
jgi:hypothetical protein